jgi:hypothetical protein
MSYSVLLNTETPRYDVISAVVLELISSRCTSGRVKKLREENREGGYPVAYLYNDKFSYKKLWLYNARTNKGISESKLENKKFKINNTKRKSQEQFRR